MTNDRLAILVDFDDTAAQQNVAETLLKAFGGSNWKGYREDFRNGSMNLRHYQEKAFNEIDATIEEMGEAICGLAWMRPGFVDFNSYCKANGIRMSFVTNGLRFYVDALVHKAGLKNIPAYAVNVDGKPGDFQYSYPYATMDCWEWGNCKCKVLEEHRENASKIVFVGDGRSDLCVSQHSDFVFARSTLLEHCKNLNLAHQEFGDFYDVLAALKIGIPNVWNP